MTPNHETENAGATQVRKRSDGHRMVTLYHGEKGESFKTRDQAVYRVADAGNFLSVNKPSLTKKQRNRLKRAHCA